MASYILFGSYSPDAVHKISAGRTKELQSALKEAGAEIKETCALLGGQYDVLVKIEVPGVKEAMKASIQATRLTGMNFTTCATVDIEEFDKVCSC
jgi:uncharacterized protein with GYD domain